MDHITRLIALTLCRLVLRLEKKTSGVNKLVTEVRYTSMCIETETTQDFYQHDLDEAQRLVDQHRQPGTVQAILDRPKWTADRIATAHLFVLESILLKLSADEVQTRLNAAARLCYDAEVSLDLMDKEAAPVVVKTPEQFYL